MVAGYVGLALGFGIAAALVALGVGVAWRATVFLPLLSGMVGVLQARRKT